VTLSTAILLALVLGVGFGVFFGEAMAVLRPVADAFIRLLQMAVLPYVVASLITGLGRLSRSQARFMARQGALLLLLLWGISLSLVMVMPLAFPDWQSASFFSTALVEPREEFDFVSLYIPANPFRSMADNVVPAVVLFSIALGVGLMRVEGRDKLIDTLDVAADALTRVTNFVVALTPIGVFAIAASAAGTLTIAEFGRLQIYLLTFSAMAGIATFWILPGLVPVLTPMRYRDVIRASRDAIITAFSTGSLFVVLPLLVERTKELIAEHEREGDEAGRVIDVLVPVSFNFPSTGKLLTLSFVLFAAWFAGTELSLGQIPVFLGSGLLTFFGSVNVALPFLFDLLRIPADMFQLFVAVGFVNFRMQTLVGVMHTMVLSLLAFWAVTGRLRVRWAALIRYVMVSVVLVFGVLVGARVFFAATLESEYQQYELITGRNLMSDPVPATIHHEPQLPPREDMDRPVLDRVRERGVLRVGYNARAQILPFVYVNDVGDLVGFDIDIFHRMARDLGVDLEFVPLDFSRFTEQLTEGVFDVSTGGVTTPRRSSEARWSTYMDLTVGLVVPDYLRHEFETYESAREIEGLTIAVPRARFYQQMTQRLFPEARTVPITSERDFFEQEGEEIHAMLHAAESVSAWTLLYPQFAVVVPQPGVIKAPFGFAVARNASEMAEFLDTWIDLYRKNGTLDTLYDYWILGQSEEEDEPRWSVIRNVLGWQAP
jgi:Na+/H+-dicarboxylate symporter